MSARKSSEPTKVTSYRISDHDETVIALEHGSLTKFFNTCVEKEVKRLEKKNKKSVKAKITKS